MLGINHRKMLTICVLTTLLFLAACANNTLAAGHEPEYIHETEYSAERAMDYEAGSFEAQLALLNEFAVSLNTGGVLLQDLRITRIESNPMQESFFVNFYHVFDLLDDALISGLLEFTGIDESNIDFRLNPWLGLHEDFSDYLLVNEAIFRFEEPSRLLREFAKTINATTYSHEVVITFIRDYRHMIDLMPIASSAARNSPRFRVGFATEEMLSDQELINAILEFTGIDEHNITFERQLIGFDYRFVDFLRVNAELGELVRQWELLEEFMHTTEIRTRHGRVMYSAIRTVSPARPDTTTVPTEDPGYMRLNPRFEVGFSSQEYLEDEELISDLLKFTGICPENIEFYVFGRNSIGWEPFILEYLSPEQLADLDKIENFMDMVNAPFWEDTYNNDPVIYRISLPLPWAETDVYREYFIILPYEPALAHLTNREIGTHLAELKTELVDYTGINPELVVFRVQILPQVS